MSAAAAAAGTNGTSDKKPAMVILNEQRKARRAFYAELFGLTEEEQPIPDLADVKPRGYPDSIIVTTSDGKTVQLDKDVYATMRLIMEMCMDLGFPEEDDPLQLPKVNSTTLANYVNFVRTQWPDLRDTYTEYTTKKGYGDHPDDEEVRLKLVKPGRPFYGRPPVDDDDAEAENKITADMDNKFLEALPLDDLFQLILACNFVGFEEGLNICCAFVASLIKNKTAEEIRSTFQITKDAEANAAAADASAAAALGAAAATADEGED